MAEQSIRVEKVTASGWGAHKGWLELTSTRLMFRRKERGQSEWEIPLAAVEGARTKKAFRQGVDMLDIIYLDEKGKRQQKSFEHSSFGRWASGNVARAEQNEFAGFERDISEARQRLSNQPSPTTPDGDRINQLERLAELKGSGVLTHAEFEREKARILAS
jgi:hypothetical protein